MSELIKVKLKTIYASPQGNFQPGNEISVSKQEANELINGGYADHVVEEMISETEDLTVEVNSDPNFPAEIKDLGNDLYELPDGEQISGKENALAAYEASKTKE